MGKIIPFKPKFRVLEFGDPREKLEARTKEIMKEYEELKNKTRKRIEKTTKF